MKNITLLLLVIQVAQVSFMSGMDSVHRNAVAKACIARTFNMARELVVIAAKRPLSKQQREALEQAFQFGEIDGCPFQARFVELRNAYHSIITHDSYPQLVANYEAAVESVLDRYEQLLEKYQNGTESSPENDQLRAFFVCGSSPGHGDEQFLLLQQRYRDLTVQRNKASDGGSDAQLLEPGSNKKGWLLGQKSFFGRPVAMLGVVVTLASIIGFLLYRQHTGKAPGKKSTRSV